MAHGEHKIARKLDHGAIVYVVRVLRKDGTLAMSRPCPDCQAILRSKRVKKVYYSINPEQYGIYIPADDTDTYFRF